MNKKLLVLVIILALILIGRVIFAFVSMNQKNNQEPENFNETTLYNSSDINSQNTQNLQQGNTGLNVIENNNQPTINQGKAVQS